MEVKDALASGVDRRYWSAAEADTADRLANRALKALSGLQRYLRSPQAKRNAERARARYLARRRVETRNADPIEPVEPVEPVEPIEPIEPIEPDEPDEP